MSDLEFQRGAYVAEKIELRASFHDDVLGNVKALQTAMSKQRAFIVREVTVRNNDHQINVAVCGWLTPGL